MLSLSAINFKNSFKSKKIETSLTQAGFTMIELMFVIAIVGILALFIKPKYDNYVLDARIKTTNASLQAIKTAITGYYMKTGQYPRHLEDLIMKPADMTQMQWGTPYLEKEDLPVDGWKHEFMYALQPKGQTPPYKLYSWGPNGDGSPDDEHISA
ncbi:MAG TPA: type II secretion system protein GspG [Candidatus Babeliales bacterium]|nr:type II secretion system protein GspG [Candidatus Babeliales bacterium]